MTVWQTGTTMPRDLRATCPSGFGIRRYGSLTVDRLSDLHGLPAAPSTGNY